MHKNIGKVIKLFISDNNKTDNSVLELKCDERGIINDKFYDKDILRSVLLSSTFSYDLCNKNNINIEPGLLGENILMDYNPYDLAVGSQIKIAEVVLEITQACTICNNLSKIHQNLPSLLNKDRGIFTKVVRAGTIKSNDLIYLI